MRRPEFFSITRVSFRWQAGHSREWKRSENGAICIKASLILLRYFFVQFRFEIFVEEESRDISSLAGNTQIASQGVLQLESASNGAYNGFEIFMKYIRAFPLTRFVISDNAFYALLLHSYK